MKRTVLEYTEEPELPELAKKLKNQKKKRNFHGLYDFVVIDLTCSSSRMASCRLTRGQVETIFRKGKIKESFEPLKVSDVIEVLNHIHCMDYILDHVMEPLTQKFIRKLHEILMTGTVDAYRQHVRPGEYRTVISRPRDRELLPVSRINSPLTALLRDYAHQTEIERNQILDFHVRFEEIFPFEDGNGRVGRLIIWFFYQLNLAWKMKFPVILHVRDAYEDVLRILRRHPVRKLGGVIHWFYGSKEIAEQYLKLGYHIGIGGSVLQLEERAKDLWEAIPHIPPDRILVETDAPFILPYCKDVIQPKLLRRARNTSLILPAVINKIAELKDISSNEVGQTTTENVIRLFNLPIKL